MTTSTTPGTRASRRTTAATPFRTVGSPPVRRTRLTPAPASVRVDGLAPGDYDVTWWDTWAGEAISTERARIDGPATLVALAGAEGGRDNATAIVRYVT